MSNLHEIQRTFLIISCLVILRKRNVSDESCTENRNTRFMFNTLKRRVFNNNNNNNNNNNYYYYY